MRVFNYYVLVFGLILLGIPGLLKAEGGHTVSSAFLNPLADKNPPLAGAIWGALIEEPTGRPERIGRSSLAPGEYSGTMRFEGRPLRYKTSVKAQAGGFRVAVALWDEGSTEIAERYEGFISKDGRKGSLSRIQSTKASSEEFSW